MRRIQVVGTALLTTGVIGCPGIIDALRPDETTVRLVNNSDFDVEIVLDYDDQQDVPSDVIDDVGQRLDFIIPAGGVESFTRDCDSLQAIRIQRAELRVIGGGGPNASSDTFRDGSDFNCRDTLTFTFDHSGLILDFDVTFRSD
ncbi:MAG: hypothetical protein JNG88_05360 [Phycisphaerales bacterium]|nr:hypothetical protein [Phycisphaerales bacterium]